MHFSIDVDIFSWVTLDFLKDSPVDSINAPIDQSLLIICICIKALIQAEWKK